MRLFAFAAAATMLSASLAAYADTLTESLVQTFGPGGIGGTAKGTLATIASILF